MKFLDKLFGRKAAELTYDQVANLIDGFSGGQVAGVTVTDKTALQVSTVLACVKVIADGCATPDLHVYREQSDGTRKKAADIPEYRLLNRRPNEWQTAFEWRRQMTIHAALTGAGLSIKVRDDKGRVRELIPVMPGQWDMRRVSRYDVRYRCWDQFGQIGDFAPEDVFILNGVQWDWIGSMNAVVLARSAIGLAIATEKSQAAMHANGLRPSGVYTVEGNLTQEQHERLAAFLKRKSGADKAGDPLVLDRSAKWTSTAINGVDAQHVETRRLQIEEICRAYGVFPIMVGHSDKSATFASSEAFFAAHVKHTLAPWHQAWMQRIDEMLLDGNGPLFAEFDTRYLMAGAMKDRALWARTMAEMGIYTRNEIRDEEGKDPLPGLDEPLTPLNMSQGKGTTNEPDPAEQDKAFNRLERKLEALSQRPPVIVNNHLPEQRNEINVRNEAPAAPNVTVNTPPVEVRNAINVPETIVNIEAVMPEQKAQQAVVNIEVQPAPVTVNNAFARKAVQVVERDGNDEITQTTTRYEA